MGPNADRPLGPGRPAEAARRKRGPSTRPHPRSPRFRPPPAPARRVSLRPAPGPQSAAAGPAQVSKARAGRTRRGAQRRAAEGAGHSPASGPLGRPSVRRRVRASVSDSLKCRGRRSRAGGARAARRAHAAGAEPAADTPLRRARGASRGAPGGRGVCALPRERVNKSRC